jgi:hypothetical protein
MGDEVYNRIGLTLQVSAPASASLRLLRDGHEICRWDDQDHATYTVPAREAGVFRVEVHQPFRKGMRAWIFSNPIYVRPG